MTHRFEGVINSSASPHVVSGDRFAGTITYDPDATDQHASDSIGEYRFVLPDDAPVGLTYTAGSLSHSTQVFAKLVVLDDVCGLTCGDRVDFYSDSRDFFDFHGLRLQVSVSSDRPPQVLHLPDPPWHLIFPSILVGRDSAGASFQGYIETLRLMASPPADFNGDGDVDADDLVRFEACATGPAVPYDPEHLSPTCALIPDAEGIIAADLDRDKDVDQVDFGLFQRCLGGPEERVDAACADSASSE